MGDPQLGRGRRRAVVRAHCGKHPCKAAGALVPDGRCSVISFKRKEANAIRRFVREHEEPDTYLVRHLHDKPQRLLELFPLLAMDACGPGRQQRKF